MKFGKEDNCEHCWHRKRGPIHMVIPDGHVVQECCKCHDHRTIHVDHLAREFEWQHLGKRLMDGDEEYIYRNRTPARRIY